MARAARWPCTVARRPLATTPACRLVLGSTFSRFKRSTRAIIEDVPPALDTVVQSAGAPALPGADLDEVARLTSELRRLLKLPGEPQRPQRLWEVLEELSALHAKHHCGIHPDKFQMVTDAYAIASQARPAVEMLVAALLQLFAVGVNGMLGARDNAGFLQTLFLRFHKAHAILAMDFGTFKHFARYVLFLGDTTVLRSMFDGYLELHCAGPEPLLAPADVLDFAVYLEQTAGLLTVEETLAFTEMRLRYRVEDAVQPLVDYYAFTLLNNAAQRDAIAASLQLLVDKSLVPDYPTAWGYHATVAEFAHAYQFVELDTKVAGYVLAALASHPERMQRMEAEDVARIHALALRHPSPVDAMVQRRIAEIGGESMSPLALQWEVAHAGPLDPDAVLVAIETYVLQQPQTNPNHLQLNTKAYNAVVLAALARGWTVAAVQQLLESLLREYDLQRDLDLFWLLMNSALDANDPTTAMALWEQLFAEGVLWNEVEGKYAMVLNRAVHASASEYLDARAMDITLDSAQCKTAWKWFTRLEGAHHKPEPATAAKLMDLFLWNREEYVGNAATIAKYVLPELGSKDLVGEAPPLAKASRDTYGPVYDLLFRYITRADLDANRNWTALGVLDEHFVVAEEHYLPLMKRFVEFDRPNAALVLFKTMKRHHRFYGLPPPSPEVYTYLYAQFGRLRYAEGVEQMHRMMTMEVLVPIDIAVLNACLLAFVGIGDGLGVRTLYNSILAIPKERGANSDTVAIMMRHYAAVGITSARQYWAGLGDYDILPDTEAYRWFIAAHGHAGMGEDALAVAQLMEENYVDMTPAVLATLHNWTQNEEQRAVAAAWASETYPAQWLEAQPLLAAVPAGTDPEAVDQRQSMLLGVDKPTTAIGAPSS